MPASPSFPSGTGTRGNRWKRRKRDAQAQGANRRPKDDDEEEEDEEDELVDREDEAAGEDPHPNTPDPNPRETEVLSEGGVRICNFPTVVKRTVNRPHSSVLVAAAAERAALVGEIRVGTGVVLENISYGQLQALSAVPADSPALVEGEGPASFVALPPKLMEGRGVVKRYGNRVHVVPMHSDWFSPATVHRLERQVVPHFFSGKSTDHTPEKFMEYRNYIVARYMENPDKRLTISDCQGLVGAIQYEDLTRIVRFLDHWGIINYCAAAPAPEPSFDVSYLKEDTQGEIVVPSVALKSIDSLIRFDKPRCRLKAADVYSPSSPKDDSIADLDSRIRERLSGNHCNHCFRPLLAVYYQSLKEVDVYLCSDCFQEGRFVIGHSSIDFTRIDSAKGYHDLDGESWTDQETLLLLEAMELYNENWNEIAEHVGTKSKAQCILHFLRLPMEDGLLENIEVSGVNPPSDLSNGGDHKSSYSTSNGSAEGSHRQDDDSENRLPFANSGNPVMALVAFLASAIAPRVAAACAHAALAALSAENGLVESGSIVQVEGMAQGHSMNSETVVVGDSVQQKGGSNEAPATPISVEKVKAAARVGLAAAATKAKLFADHEEREIQRLSANIINQQLKRLELKLKQFAEVETLLMRECEQVEKARHRLASDRARVISSRFGPAGSTSSLGPGMSPSPNPRSPIMSGPPSQPGISGYGQQMGQQSQSPMPFMPRQQMGFSLGPRLPLSAINASSSSSPSSNPMFNAPVNNAQPTVLNHPMLRSASSAGSNLG
ncbi:SWI/SNF complex subunit SWI3C isoform X1 [Punica granatum]|nr:SWI/SNF complex subunit SWI3C isoform X1 [Punica granatum]